MILAPDINPIDLERNRRNWQAFRQFLDSGATGEVVSKTANGVEWGTPASGGITILSQSTGPQTVTNTNAETTIFSVSIPGNTLSSTAKLRVTIWGQQIKNTTGDLTFRFKYGSTTMYGDAVAGYTNSATARPFHIQYELGLNGSTSAQALGGTAHLINNVAGPTVAGVGNWDGVTLGGPFTGVATETSTGALNLIFTLQWGGTSTSLSATVYGWVIELLS